MKKSGMFVTHCHVTVQVAPLVIVLPDVVPAHCRTSGGCNHNAVSSALISPLALLSACYPLTGYGQNLELEVQAAAGRIAGPTPTDLQLRRAESESSRAVRP